MKLRTLAIAYAVPFFCMTGSAMAQQSPPPPNYPSNYYRTNPTPEEQAATNDLNAKQAAMRGVTASGQTGTSVSAQYQNVLQRYQAQRRAYEAAMQEYERRYGHPKP